MKSVMFAGLALIAVAGSAQAQILAQSGFEASEGYALGNIVGQNGWLTDGGGTAGTVSTDRAYTGTRSLKVDTAPLLSAWYFPLVSYDGNTAANKTVRFNWAMYITQGSNSTRWGMDIYDTAVARITSLDAVLTGGSYVMNYWNGTAYVASSTTIATNAWNTFQIDVNFATSTATFYVNNTVLASGISVSGSKLLSDADLRVGGANFDLGYFDDYKVEAIPTPGAIALLGLGGLVAGRRRRA